MLTPRALLVTDQAAVPEPVLRERLGRAAALPAEVRARLCVMLRDPQLDAESLVALGRRLRAACRELGASFVVNDRLDVALALEADGLHLGRTSLAVADVRARLGARLWLSRSCHGLGELPAISAEAPDAVLLSPVFPSPGKGAALGLDVLTAARRALGPTTALLALGGVTSALAPACLAAGADGVAAIRADLVAALADGA